MNKLDMTRTQWFDYPDNKPINPGVYEVMVIDRKRKIFTQVFLKNINDFSGFRKVRKWRGLAINPKVKS